MKKVILALMAVAAIALTGCDTDDTKEDPQIIGGDFVVYGKIYTAEVDSSKSSTDKDYYKMADAMVVKDGKFIYVGTENGAKEYVGKDTKVIDWRKKGMIMPTCANGHAHYILGYGLKSTGLMFTETDDVPSFLNKVKAEAVRAKAEGRAAILGFGWNYHIFEGSMPTRYDLDKICSDIPMYFADEEGHKGLANTLCLQIAGILDKNGKPLMKKDDIRGGEIVVNAANGDPTGFLKEQAGTYVRCKLENDKLYTVDVAKNNLKDIERYLLSVGYTMYMDGWSNYFNNTNAYEAAKQLDENNDLHMLLGMSYEIESWNDLSKAMKAANQAKNYKSKHVNPGWIKLFMDGTVEGGTGYTVVPYVDHEGIVNWTEEELTNITNQANSNGLPMHVHTMGDAAVKDVVEAFRGHKEMRNTVVHVRNVHWDDWQKMADNNIYATVGMLWHHFHPLAPWILALGGIVPPGYETESYPMKSYFKYGINMSSHTDYPALSGSPDDPFGIMEIAVTGIWDKENEGSWGVGGWWPAELLSRQQALQTLTINGAKQLFLENERGSIKKDKYADFLLIDQDVLTCEVGKIRDTKVVKTFFEGNEVYPRE